MSSWSAAASSVVDKPQSYPINFNIVFLLSYFVPCTCLLRLFYSGLIDHIVLLYVRWCDIGYKEIFFRKASQIYILSIQAVLPKCQVLPALDVESPVGGNSAQATSRSSRCLAATDKSTGAPLRSTQRTFASRFLHF